MKTSEKALLSIMAGWIHEQKTQNVVGIEAQDIQAWQELLHLAKIHALGGICYLALRDNTDCPVEIREQFGRMFNESMSIAICQEAEMEKLSQSFERYKIPYIPFKGWKIRAYYPVPELRTMSDVDFLIRKEDRKKAEEALERAGFKKGIGAASVLVYSQGILTVEMHLNPGVALGNKMDYVTWFQDAFSHGIFENENCEGSFELEYHFVFLMFHLAKHMHSTGAGVRMFLDIAVFWKHFEGTMDWEKVMKMLKGLRLNKFSRYVFWLCKKWFGVEIPGAVRMPEGLYEQLLKYVFIGGTYGHEEHTIGDMYARWGILEAAYGHPWLQRLHGYLICLFPGRDQMEAEFRGVKKYPFLLPVAWLKRWYRGLFLHRSQSFETLKKIGKSGKDAEEEYKMLKGLGIKN